MRTILFLFAVSLSACSPVYKLSINQGNVITQDKLDQVTVGMSPEQVIYLMGTPLVVNEFQTNRWDYVSYFRYPSGRERQRSVSIYFDNGKVAHIDDSDPPETEPAKDAEATAS